MMRKILFMAVIVSMFMWVGSVWAVTITYTADNDVNAWYVQGSSGAAVSQSIGANSNNWRSADTAVLNLAPASTYAFVWSVINFGSYSNSNPAAFLAQIVLGNGDIILTDSSWRYSLIGKDFTDFNDDSWEWKNVVGYGENDSANIWRNNNGGNPVAGISTDAQWIWSVKNFSSGDTENESNLFIRYDVRTAQVPEPGTLLLFGTGLAGLALYRRRSMNK